MERWKWERTVLLQSWVDTAKICVYFIKRNGSNPIRNLNIWTPRANLINWIKTWKQTISSDWMLEMFTEQCLDQCWEDRLVFNKQITNNVAAYTPTLLLYRLLSKKTQPTCIRYTGITSKVKTLTHVKQFISDGTSAEKWLGHDDSPGLCWLFLKNKGSKDMMSTLITKNLVLFM